MGNHFIEIDKDLEGNVYLVIHTGSRNLGQQVCRYYQAIAVDDCNVKSEEVKAKTEQLIAEYKEALRHKEIKDAVRELREKYAAVEKVPEDLCYLEGSHRDDYLHDMKICQEYAVKNREEIARRILGFLKVDPVEVFHTVHNYINFEDNIIRKGAVSARLNETLLIPINMRDGSLICKGKGNDDWNQSAPHGAGRILSRKKAISSLSIYDFEKAMHGIYSSTVCEGTIDESPMAYKSIDDIVNNIGPTVDILKVIKPVYNFKASS